ncbi:MAG: hypothetical protein OCU24_01105 [Candidatus Methanospirare jalkutatii]|nr:hypothetical protein [Candidatus Methanospirare jalkutatii]
MRGRISAALLVIVVVCLAVVVAHVIAQPSPFVICGLVSTSGGEPCDNPAVSISNLNTGVEWQAETNAINYYQLILDSNDVNAGDILRFNASCCDQLKTIEHEVTQSDIDNGGILLNISLEAPINIFLRADSITGNIFNVSYTVNPGTVTEDGVTINNQTAMGAIVAYCQDNGINVDITSTWGWAYLLQIGNNESDYNYWCYAVDEVVPGVGGAQYSLSGGEFVHWYNCGLNYYTVLTTLNTSMIIAGGYLNATVTWKNLSGKYPLQGADVYVSSAAYTPGTKVGTTGSDGNVTFQWSIPGVWYVYAVDPVHGSGIYNYPPVSFTCEATTFDTGRGTYPSISGTHYGTIIPSRNITVNRIYSYPCAGTGGHIEYVKIWNETTGECAVAEWNGYHIADYHNLSFNTTLTLEKGVIYNYIIKTGSYPQIIHAHYKQVNGGNITCTLFRDANGKEYDDWIPAFRLWYAA